MYDWLAPYKDRKAHELTKGEMSLLNDSLTPGHSHIFLSRARALFAYGRGLDLICDHDPFRGLKAPESGEYRPWTQEELQAFLRSSTPDMAMAIRLAYYTGQRMGDVLAMKWSDIKDGCIHVRQQKTGAVLAIPLHPRLKTALRQHERHQKKAGVQTTHILTMSNGEPFSADTFRCRFRRERIAASLPNDVVFHGLRKLMAVSLSEGGASTQEIMAVGGWKTAKQVSHYCKGARQKVLAGSAIGKLEGMA